MPKDPKKLPAMPNHVDVRAFFHGDASGLRCLLDRCRQHAAKPEAFLSAWIPSAQAVDWTAAVSERLERGAEPFTAPDGGFGAIPALGEGAPFTFNAGAPMPESLLIEDSSWGRVGQQILEGRWTIDPIYHPRSEELRACLTRQEAEAWARENMPGALENGQARLDNARAHGHETWYSWAVANWGTKWDAYDCSWSPPQLSGRFRELRMNTAWSPPIPALSKICSTFSISCSCSFIDEGGGFAGYCLIGPDGSASEPRQPPGGARRLVAAARAAAKSALAAATTREGLASAPAAPPWATELAAGGLPSERSLRKASAARSPNSAQAADAALRCIGPGGALSSEMAAQALDALSRSGALLPGDACTSGYEIGLAFCHGLWREGAQWCIDHGGEAFARKAAFCSAFASLERNDPDSASWSAGILEPDAWSGLDWRAAALRAPEAALALAGRPGMPSSAIELCEESLNSLANAGPGIAPDRVQSLIAQAQKTRLGRELPRSAARRPGKPSSL